MARIGFLLSHGPFQDTHWEMVYNLALEGFQQGHEVSIFLVGDGVYSLVREQNNPEFGFQPSQRFRELALKGARIFASGFSMNARGCRRERDFVDGIAIVDYSDLSEEIAATDRLVSL